MAEQLPIDGQAWETLSDREYFDNQETIPPWIGVESYEEIDWTEYTEEELNEFCSILQKRKGFLNGVHQACIDERVKRTKERNRQIVQSGEALFRPDVRRRMAEERQDFWERHK